MKIAILTPTFFPYSGIDRVVESQAKAFVKKKHAVTVFCLDGSITIKGVRVVKLGMPKNATMQALYRLFFFMDNSKVKLYKKLKGFDKVIGHFYPMTVLASKARREFDIEYHYHDHGVNVSGPHDSFMQAVYMRLFAFFSNKQLKNVDKAVSVSKYLSRELKKQSNIESRVLYNSIDIKKYHAKVSSAAVVKKYGLKDKKVLLYVGRIAPHKGVHTLIDVYKALSKKYTNVELLVVGKPTVPSYMQKLTKSQPSGVRFLGVIDDAELPALYKAAAVYVTASGWEGFDIPAVQAQACGTPVVCYDVGSHPEVVSKGQLVPFKNKKKFARAVASYLK